MKYISEQLIDGISAMLHERALRGNCQSKHGLDAATEWECWNFIDALDDWLTRRERLKARGFTNHD